jgi:nucleoside 2-deoxyribosyltransferase
MSFKIIKPDSPDQDATNLVRVFLAGSIDNGKASPWADQVAEKLSDLRVAAYNPRRDNWLPDLEPRMHEPVFAQQVNWELNSIDEADIIFFYFERDSVSPITLQELGYSIGRDEHVVVCCPDGFWRKGNVEVMCSRNGIHVYNTLDAALLDLRTRVKRIEGELVNE